MPWIECGVHPAFSLCVVIIAEAIADKVTGRKVVRVRIVAEVNPDELVGFGW